MQQPLDEKSLAEHQGTEIVHMHLADRGQHFLFVKIEVADAVFFPESHPGIFEKLG